MSVAKDKSTGLWYYVFKVKNPITDKVSWKKKRGFATKRDALHAEADAQRLTQDTSGELTFKEMADTWIALNHQIQCGKLRELTLFRGFPNIMKCQSKNNTFTVRCLACRFIKKR